MKEKFAHKGKDKHEGKGGVQFQVLGVTEVGSHVLILCRRVGEL